MKKIKIIGLNIGSGASSPTGRGFFDSKNKTFCYIPLNEVCEQRIKFTYRDLNNPTVNKNVLDLACHYDPEFKTFTYGHIQRGFGDHILYKPDLLEDSNVYLFFYATLNIDNNPLNWGTFIIGFLEVEKIINVTGFSNEKIFSLTEFKNNAHLRRKEPFKKNKKNLLIKGSTRSRLYTRAIQLSKSDDPTEINPQFVNLITTTSGKKVKKSKGLHRYVFYSENPSFLEILMKQV